LSDVITSESHGGNLTRAWRKWSGVALVLLAGFWFACLLAVPFTGFSTVTKAFLGTAFFVLMEGSFYLGVFLMGQQLLSRYWAAVKDKVRHRSRSEPS